MGGPRILIIGKSTKVVEMCEDLIKMNLNYKKTK